MHVFPYLLCAHVSRAHWPVSMDTATFYLYNFEECCLLHVDEHRLQNSLKFKSQKSVIERIH